MCAVQIYYFIYFAKKNIHKKEIYFYERAAFVMLSADLPFFLMSRHILKQ